MPEALLGRCGFEDCNIPVAGKSEWGMDTLTRKMKGHVSLLSTFMQSLTQGQMYVDAGSNFYLQTFEPDDATPVATVTLVYKGLRYGTPIPDVQSSVVSSVGSTSADYSAENSGKGRIYKTIPLWHFSYVEPTGFEEDVENGSRKVYTTGATMEFNYKAAETKYRYVQSGRPTGARYSVTDIVADPSFRRVRIVTSDGSIYGIERQVFFGLTPVASPTVVSFSSKNVIGTPFYECEDVIRLEYGNAA